MRALKYRQVSVMSSQEGQQCLSDSIACLSSALLGEEIKLSVHWELLCPQCWGLFVIIFTEVFPEVLKA